MKTNKQELMELMLGAGYITGEITEATKDGVGFEDLKSIKDMVENRETISNMKVEAPFKELFTGLEYADLVEIIMEFNKGMNLGLK